MNETLYRWTFNFHKVVRLQNSGVVEDFILLYSAVYLRIQKWKNYWNRSTFAKVIVKIKVAPFLWPTVYLSPILMGMWHRGSCHAFMMDKFWGWKVKCARLNIVDMENLPHVWLPKQNNEHTNFELRRHNYAVSDYLVVMPNIIYYFKANFRDW